jgi:hypothetical protein
MSSLTKPSFWIDLGERTVRAFAQGAVAVLAINAATTPITALPWITAAAVGASAAVIAVISGIASVAVPGSDPATASFLPPPEQTPALLKSMLRRS